MRKYALKTWYRQWKLLMKADWLQRSLAFECKFTRIFKIISSSASPLSYSAYCGIGHWKVTVHFVSRLSFSFLACWLCSPPPPPPPQYQLVLNSTVWLAWPCAALLPKFLFGLSWLAYSVLWFLKVYRYNMHSSYWLPWHAFLLLITLTCMLHIGYLDMHSSHWLPWHAFLPLVTLTYIPSIGYLDMHLFYWLPWPVFLLFVTLTCIPSICYLDLHSSYYLSLCAFLLLVILVCIPAICS